MSNLSENNSNNNKKRLADIMRLFFLPSAINPQAHNSREDLNTAIASDYVIFLSTIAVGFDSLEKTPVLAGALITTSLIYLYSGLKTGLTYT